MRLNIIKHLNYLKNKIDIKISMIIYRKDE